MIHSTVRQPISLKMLTAIKYRPFRLFWIGQSISLTGTWLQNLALVWLALSMTNSPFWTGLIWVIQFLPTFFLSFHAGSLSDRFSKRKLFCLTQLAMVVVAIGLTIATRLEILTYWELLGIAFILGLVNTFDLPARQGLISEMVNQTDLLNALALNAMIFNFAKIIGPLIAGIVIHYLEIDSCFFLNAVSFLPLLLILRSMRLPDQGDGQRELSLSVKLSFRKEIKEGFRDMVRNKAILTGLLLLGTINFFGFLYMLIPFYLQNVYQAGSIEFGIIFAAGSFGALLGSLAATFIDPKLIPVKQLIICVISIALLEMALAWVINISLAYLIAGLIGFAMNIFDIILKALIQIQTPANFRGRMFTFYAFMFMGLGPIGMLVIGMVACLWEVSFGFQLNALLSLLFAIGLIWKFPYLLRQRLL
jgi:MFS family permease